MLKRPVILFSVTTFIIVGGVYYLITSSTPLGTMQAIGIGVAFVLGWLGLAYAGSEALEAMMRRRMRMASREAAVDRTDAAVKRLVRQGIVQPKPLDLPVAPPIEAAKAAGEKPAALQSVGSAKTANARAELVAKRYSRDGALPQLPLQREELEQQPPA